ncbi:MAG TPA: hypothetical protein VGL72_10425 [Bryobacteraceae bacterium]|jgi:hypothetical protein
MLNPAIRSLLAALVLAAVPAIVTAESCPAVKTTIGYIVRSSGNWFVASTSPAAAEQQIYDGCRLDAGGRLYGRFATPFFVEIELLDGSSLPITCTPGPDCSVVLPQKIGKPRSLLSEILASIRNIPVIYRDAITGAEGDELSDGIASIQSGQVDLAPVLKAVSPGELTIRFSDLQGQDQAAAKVAWDGTRASVPVTIPAGLYLVTVNEGLSAQKAWILLVNDQNLKTAREGWSELIGLNWPSETAKRIVLRAYLARQSGK